MNVINPAGFTALVALVGLVILVAGLASGLIKRLGLPFVAVFLGGERKAWQERGLATKPT